MKSKLIELIEILTIMASSFILSFIGYNGVHFVLSIPICISLALYKENYFIFSYISILIASIFFANIYIFTCLVFTFFMAILMFVMNRKKEIKLTHLSSIISVFTSILVVSAYCHYLGADDINYLVIPTIFALLTYNVSCFLLKMKSKQNFTMSWYEFILFSVILNYAFLGMGASIGVFNFSYFFGAILIYLACRIDLKGGLVSYLITMFFYYPQNDSFEIIMLGLSLIFLIRILRKHKKTASILYFPLALVLGVSTKEYGYLIESLAISFAFILIPSSLFNEFSKYLGEEKTEKGDFYRDQYFKSMNKSKKIYELMEIIKNKIKENPRMKKKYNDQILEDLSFLITKSQKEIDVDIKEKLKEELEYLKLDLIGIKVSKDTKEDFLIELEIKNEIDYKKIKTIIENITKKKFSLVCGKYNFLINSTTYIFENKEEYIFDYIVKQRSVDEICGDSYLCFKANNKKYFLVSDGMGHGKRACEDSKFALFLLKSFIELGMETKKSIKACNALVFSKNDSYNTLDLLEYDCYSNEFVLYKNGSGNSYIQKKDTVSSLTSQNLPLGIVDEIVITKIHIGDNVDRIILTSDGVNQNIIDIINKYKKDELKKVVDEIFEMDEIIEDDQTIIAINVIKKEIV